MISELFDRGIRLKLSPEGFLLVKGNLSEADDESIRHNRDLLISELRTADRSPHPKAPASALRDWWRTLDTDWQEVFDERAAIREYDGGMTRLQAERVAALALDDARLTTDRLEGYGADTALLASEIEQEVLDTGGP